MDKKNPPNLVTDKLEGLYCRSSEYNTVTIFRLLVAFDSHLKCNAKVTKITLTTKLFAIKLRFVKNLFALKAFS